MNEFKHVDKKAKTKWRVSRTIGLIAIVAVLFPITAVLAASTALGAWSWLIFGVIVLLQLANLIVYPIIEYIQWQYMIAEDRIEIKKGIFWRSHCIVPISRIQHVCTVAAPLQRMFGLASVAIYTAGGTHVIQELNKETATQICELLQNEVNKRIDAMIALEKAKLAELEGEQGAEV